MNQPPKFLILLAIVLPVVVLGLLLMRALPVPPQDDEQVQAWFTRWEAQSEEQSRAELQAVPRNRAGCTQLAQALASQRTACVQETRRLIVEWFQELELVDDAHSGAIDAAMMHELAKRMGQYSTIGRRAAAELATRRIAAPRVLSADLYSRFLTDCQQILTFQSSADVSATVQVDPHDIAVQREQLQRLKQPEYLRSSTSDDSAPFAPLPLNDSKPSTTNTRVNEAESNQGAERPRLLAPQSAPARPQNEISTTASANHPAVLTSPLMAMPLIELLSQLHVNDAPQATAAERELLRRGCSQRQIEIGRALTSPLASERRRWADALPHLADIDAKPWLLWLSRDADADVRRTVVTLMATSREPELLRRLAEIAATDENEVVRELAARVTSPRRSFESAR